MNTLLSTSVTAIPMMEQLANISEMLLRFGINALVTLFIIHCLYYTKSKRRDYYFTFMIISTSIFFLIFLLGGVKIKIGFALGLFAVFGIIHYRTEQVPIREMTYLFVIIAISVINALACDFSYLQLGITNLIFISGVWILESNRWLKHISTKLIQYDRIDLIKPERYQDLLEDLKERTGLDIEKVEVGYIDFLKDASMLKVFYKPTTNEINSVEFVTKNPKDDFQ
ncbi:MAG: DUF4956 domain-containing protein [Bacteroidaceae bacterium]|nr:DUF4956 domain-containing protein [Bacteroidaceae bacterium]